MEYFRQVIWPMFFVLLLPLFSSAQVSQGGVPLEFPKLKSTKSFVVEMPPFQKKMLKQTIADPVSGNGELKPFRFAHAFEVDLSPKNAGQWLDAGNGIFCWRLKISSPDAKSINLIFDDFSLPSGAKLFLYSEKYGHVLGAFTSANNKKSRKFAVSPVLGDEIVVQYEIPQKYKSSPPFRITRVNHDFVGILKDGERRPLGIVAGACNIDVNCDEWEEWETVKNSVCRMIVDGKEICTGVLVNNTAENQKPYILSAAHCYDEWELAETTVYTFNYESPFCAPLDGDPSNSISGAVMKAQFDSLDFALAEMTLVPPPDFRPYFSGWDRSANIALETVSIHHPQGDIKKIAKDQNPAIIADFQDNYTDMGFWKIGKWEFGVTEQGSSGGPLFNEEKKVIGTLTGGVATCSNPVRDYFERFSMSWDYKNDSSKQLKHWLDPIGAGSETVPGRIFYENEKFCAALTNLTDADSYELVSIVNSGQFSGYWGGSNAIGITEFVEKFYIMGNEQLSGISFGVGKTHQILKSNNSEITVKVYNGSKLPETVIYEQIVEIDLFVEDAMNFIGFNRIVEPEDSFFVGFELSNMQTLDTFVVYQSLRRAYEPNTFYIKQNGVWSDFKDANPSGKSMANVFELLACNVNDFSTDSPHVENPLEILIFPNPANSTFVVETGQDLRKTDLAVFNLIGQTIEVKMNQIAPRKIRMDLTGNVPGVYFVRYNNGKGFVTSKVSYVPW